jgi:VWFA-related protein
MTMLRHLAALLLPLVASAPLAAQQPSEPPADAQTAPPAAAPTFPSRIEQVVVDVVVTDKEHRAVTGLTAADMTVLEDGVPQTIVSFEAVEVPEEPSAAPAPRPRVSTNTSVEGQRGQTGRTFVIVFDDVHLTLWKAPEARGAVKSFLENGVREGDRVMLVSTSGQVGWTARMESGRDALIDTLMAMDGRYIPDRARDWMTDYEAVRIYNYYDVLVQERVLRRWMASGLIGEVERNRYDVDRTTISNPQLVARATEVYNQAISRMQATLQALERVTWSLTEVKGRKSVILVSEGFVQDVRQEEFKRLSEACRRANAAIYFLNARGLEGMPFGMGAEFSSALPDQDIGAYFADAQHAAAGAEDVASDSGGFTVSNTNDLAEGIQRIASENQAYYLLGYVPTNKTPDGRFRNIEVKLAEARGLRVRARKGYYAPSETGEGVFEAGKGVASEFQTALDSPWEEGDLSLRMTDYVGGEKMLGRASVRIAAELDIREMQFQEQDERSHGEAEFSLIAVHRQTGEYFSYDQTYTLALLPATRERLERLWMPIVRDFDLAPGDYQAKIVVRDKGSGRIGSVIHEFEVPPLEEFRVSTPVLSDAAATTPAEEGVPGGTLSLLARREFAVDSNLMCQIEVYGAKKDEKTGMPTVWHGFRVRGPDGSIVASVAPTAITPTSLGYLTRQFGFRLAGAPLGEYEIIMTFRDELSGKTIELHEPFTVVPSFGFEQASAATAAATPAGTSGNAPDPSVAPPGALPPGAPNAEASPDTGGGPP